MGHKTVLLRISSTCPFRSSSTKGRPHRALNQAQHSRHFSSSLPKPTRLRTIEDVATGDPNVPRWKQTPREMKLPFRVRLPARQKEFICNDDPKVLHAVYDTLLGKGGWSHLTEETRWLAVTHKSFDQGRRGFNDRLSYFGKRLVEKECTLGLIKSPNVLFEKFNPAEQSYQDPRLKGVEGLTAEMKSKFIYNHRLGALADQYGLGKVVRWKPKSTSNLVASGYNMVLAQALYAIVGAVALERGGAEATKFVREKVLGPFGIRWS